MDKITQKERKLLIVKKLDLINSNRVYRRDIFKTYYGTEELKSNMEVWEDYDEKKKIKIVKQLIELEDKTILQYAFKLHKLNIPKAMAYIKNFKNEQLKEFGVR